MGRFNVRRRQSPNSSHHFLNVAQREDGNSTSDMRRTPYRRVRQKLRQTVLELDQRGAEIHRFALFPSLLAAEQSGSNQDGTVVWDEQKSVRLGAVVSRRRIA